MNHHSWIPVRPVRKMTFDELKPRIKIALADIGIHCLNDLLNFVEEHPNWNRMLLVRPRVGKRSMEHIERVIQTNPTWETADTIVNRAVEKAMHEILVNLGFRPSSVSISADWSAKQGKLNISFDVGALVEPMPWER